MTSKQEQDYYTTLGLNYGASHDQIISAYRNLARQYHPDKNINNKTEAEEKFKKLKTAYEVLSNPNKRIIYNQYGVEGLKYQDWALEHKKLDPQELQDQFEKLQRKIIENLISTEAKPWSSFTLCLDASSSFSGNRSSNDDTGENNDEDEEGDDIIIELTSMSASMRVENELSTNHSLTMNGSVLTKNGTGEGNFGTTYDFKYSKNTLFQFGCLFGNKTSFSTGFHHNLSQKTLIYGQTFLLVSPYGLVPGFALSLDHQIKKNVIGKVTYRDGPRASLKTSLIYVNQELMLTVTTSYKLGLINQSVWVDFDYKFNDAKSKLTLSLGAHSEEGLSVSYGCQTRVMEINVVGASISLSVPSGITLKLRFVRANQEFNLPIYLSDEITSGPLFYGTMVPIITYFVIDRCYSRYMKPKNLFSK